MEQCSHVCVNNKIFGCRRSVVCSSTRPPSPRRVPSASDPPPRPAAVVLFWPATVGRRAAARSARGGAQPTPTAPGHAAVSSFGQTPAGTRRPRGRSGRGCGRAPAARAGVRPPVPRRHPQPAPAPSPCAYPHLCAFIRWFLHPPRFCLVPGGPPACVFRDSSPSCPPAAVYAPRAAACALLCTPPRDPTPPVRGTAALLLASRRSRGNSESTKGRAPLRGGHRHSPSTSPHPPLPPLARFDPCASFRPPAERPSHQPRALCRPPSLSPSPHPLFFSACRAPWRA